MIEFRERPKVMGRKKIRTNLLLISILPFLHEFWQLWKGDMRIINPWLALDYPYSIQWFFKDIGEKLSLLALCILVFRFSRMSQPLRIAAWVALMLQISDVILYVVNFNKFNYLIVYLPATPITLILALYKDDISLWFNRSFYATRRKLIRGKLKFELWKRNRRNHQSVPCGTTTIIKQQTVEA